MKKWSTREEGQFELPILGSQAADISAEALFDTWLQHQRPPMAPSTQRVYRTLWRRFLQALQDHKKQYTQIKPVDIRDFLSNLDEVRRPQRERYQQVIARAYEELCRQDGRSENPATAPAINDPFKESWRQAPDNQATQFLSVDQCSATIKALQNRWRVLELASDMTIAARWREYRDMTIVAVMLGAGLRPVELGQLHPSAIGVAQRRAGPVESNEADEEHTTQWRDGTILLKLTGAAKREVVAPIWCEAILRSWLIFSGAEDASAWAKDSRVFPGSRQVSAARPQAQMNPATLARIVSKWGIKQMDLVMTPQRLRNTFGAGLIERGFSLPEIEEIMGYAPGAASAWRLQASWLAWLEAQKTPADPAITENTQSE
ncbi:site-specific integrase [Alcaligenes faecalis]|uniref:site-specific integrase n=1 Tax=Alcaligenes faecalis TaxID=511 RepID=UPI00214F91D5|nr:site-specific integrase [Alcaligenes faecalis]MCR4142714.1 site-specific integrase [Alcaligenes faecalis]